MTACPAGVNYVELFEAARAEVEQGGVLETPQRDFWRWLTLEVLFMRPRLLRAAGVLLRCYQRAAWSGSSRTLRLTRLLPRNLRESGAADAADVGQVLRCADRRGRASARRIAPSRRAAHRLRAGPGLLRRQPRHRGRAAGERLRSRHAPRAVLLRLAARAQRRAASRRGTGAAGRSTCSIRNRSTPSSPTPAAAARI